MHSLRRFISDQKLLVILSVSAGIFIHFFMNRAYVKMGVSTNRATKFKIYWAGEKQPYSEERSAGIRIDKRKDEYLFYLTNLKDIAKLRIDPAETSARIRITDIIIKQNNYKKIRFSNPDEFNNLTPLNDIKGVQNDGNGLLVLTSGNDPQLEIEIEPHRLAGGYPTDICRLICFIAFFIILFNHFRATRASAHFTYVSYLMIVAGTLVLTMAGMSKYNRHPDEYVHVKAGEYYEDHWIPPEICEEGTENTYSVYGVSRLNSHELVYFIAGKFSALFAFLPIDTFFRLRAFNVLLFLILIGYSIRLPEYRIVSIPLLLSPQIWYIFSYFNSDAFSLFFAFVFIYQLIHEESRLNRYFSLKNEKIHLLSGLTLGLLFYIMVTLKKNFYFFLIFILLYFMIKLFDKKFTHPYILIKRLIFVFSVLMLIVCARFAGDIYVNGTDQAKKLYDCRERLAKTAYKPSTPLEKKIPGLNLKARGVSLKDVLAKYRWGEKTFRSAFGVYGYTSISASQNYYHLTRIIGILLLLVISWSALIGTSRDTRLLLLNAMICSILLIGAALWKSWTSDFQAQGRYLLPIIAMVGFLLYQIKTFLNARILCLLVVIMFLLSVYSFIFVGLTTIPKHV